MGNFRFKAKEGPDLNIEDVLEAKDLKEAINTIVNRGLVPIEVYEEFNNVKKKRQNIFRPKNLLVKSVGLQEIVFFTRQMSDLVGASVGILRSLKLTGEQTKNIFFKEVIDDVYVFVKEGGSFSQGLARHNNVFSSLYVNMVQTGEVGCNLEIVLTRLADFLENDLEIKNKIKLSLAYPLFILFIGLATMFALIVFVVPNLALVFEDLGQELPLLTVFLMGVSQYFFRFWFFIFSFGVLGILSIKHFLSSTKGRKAFDAIKLKIPFLSDFIKITEISNFARTLSTLIECGVTMISALDAACLTIENTEIKYQLLEVKKEVAKGLGLSAALMKTSIFPKFALSMVSAGEEAGKIEVGLKRIAQSFQRRSDQVMKMLLSLLGPMVLVVIFLFVGLIIMALLLPIFNMNILI